jgi:phosphoribosylformylglycinamidine cyclo-ligase
MSKEYAAAGVDPSLIKPFKKLMRGVSARTRLFPRRRGVYVDTEGCYHYTGGRPHKWKQVTEGLGNKIEIAEILYRKTGVAKFDTSALDTMRMAFNDVAAQGAMPVTYTDEAAPRNSAWFNDPIRANSMAAGFYEGCEYDDVALVGGESPALRFLVIDNPVMSGCAVGLIAPISRQIKNSNVTPGLAIVGVGANGMHSNGASIVLDRGPKLSPDGLLTRMPNGEIFAEAILRPTPSYVRLVERIQDAGVTIVGIVPGTGGGVAKLMDAIPNEMTFCIRRWMDVPYVLQFMRERFELGIRSCLTTFNWGVGYYLFVWPGDVEVVCRVGKSNGYDMGYLGDTVEGPMTVEFQPEEEIFTPE